MCLSTSLLMGDRPKKEAFYWSSGIYRACLGQRCFMVYTLLIPHSSVHKACNIFIAFLSIRNAIFDVKGMLYRVANLPFSIYIVRLTLVLTKQRTKAASLVYLAVVFTAQAVTTEQY
ncbi:hypothetical protein AT1219_70202 [Vibrio alginolyticus]